MIHSNPCGAPSIATRKGRLSAKEHAFVAHEGFGDVRHARDLSRDALAALAQLRSPTRSLRWWTLVVTHVLLTQGVPVGPDSVTYPAPATLDWVNAIKPDVTWP